VRALAASNITGQRLFVPGLRAKARLAGGQEQTSFRVRTVDVFQCATGPIDLMKIDIEGGEWAILADPRMAALDVTAIRLEWHRRHCPEDDARLAAERLLRDAGFTGILHAPTEHDRNGVIWAWRERSRGLAAAGTRGGEGCHLVLVGSPEHRGPATD
jgi:hypothetical protein